MNQFNPTNTTTFIFSQMSLRFTCSDTYSFNFSVFLRVQNDPPPPPPRSRHIILNFAIHLIFTVLNKLCGQFYAVIIPIALSPVLFPVLILGCRICTYFLVGGYLHTRHQTDHKDLKTLHPKRLFLLLLWNMAAVIKKLKFISSVQQKIISAANKHKHYCI